MQANLFTLEDIRSLSLLTATQL